MSNSPCGTVLRGTAHNSAPPLLPTNRHRRHAQVGDIFNKLAPFFMTYLDFYRRQPESNRLPVVT